MRFLVLLLLSFMMLFADIGTISMLNGDASVTRDGKVSTLSIGDSVQEGDRINTFEKSRLQIILKDDTVISLGRNSEYIIESYSDGFRPNLEMRLNRGFMRTISGEIGKLAPERFKLKTKNSTIGIRGTGWLSYVNGDTENYLCFSGEIVVNTPDGVFNIPKGYMLLGKDGVYKKTKANMKVFNAKKNLQSDLKSKPFSTPKLQMPKSGVGYIESDIEQPKYNESQYTGSKSNSTQDLGTVSQSSNNNVLKRGSSMVVTAVGQGVAPRNISNKARAMAMAKRAAIVDGYRALAEQVNGVYVEGKDTIKNMAVKRSRLRSEVLAIVQNADVVETKFKDGLYEVQMEIRIYYDSFK